MDPLLDPAMAEWLRQKQEALGQAIGSDKTAQEDEDRRSLLMQFAQSYANKRPMPVAPRRVTEARDRFGVESGLEDRARGYGMDAMRFAGSMAEKDAARRAEEARRAEDRAARASERDEDRRFKLEEREFRAQEGEKSRAVQLEAAKASAARKNLATPEDLRKEFQGDPTVKNTKTIAESYAKIAGTSETGPGDVSLIYSYMRMVDPGSTVREGEFATAANAGAVPDRVVGLYNRVIGGEKLPPEVRKQFRDEAGKLYQAQIDRYSRMANEYRRLATESGISPESVVLDLGFSLDGGTPAAPGPQPQGDAPPVAGAVKTKSGRWAVKNASGQWEYL